MSARWISAPWGRRRPSSRRPPGADLVYVANQPPGPAGEAIIVPKDSALRSVADLKGRKVALNKGSNVHYLLVKALEKAGLRYTDVQTVFLPPADARAAFERGSVDAWVIWDPFLAAAERQIGARQLADGTGLVSNHQFYLAARPYAEQHPQVIASHRRGTGPPGRLGRIRIRPRSPRCSRRRSGSTSPSPSRPRADSPTACEPSRPKWPPSSRRLPTPSMPCG